MLTLAVRVPSERLTRFYGEYVGQEAKTYANPQKLLSSVPHNRITSLLREVADRHVTTAPPSFYLPRRVLSIAALLGRLFHFPQTVTMSRYSKSVKVKGASTLPTLLASQSARVRSSKLTLLRTTRSAP